MFAGENNIVKEKNNRNKLLRPFWIMVFSVLLVAVVGYFDYITGPYLSFHIFYLFPVGLTLWLAGRWPSFIILLMSVFAWFVDDIESSFQYHHLLVPYWNLAVKLSFFLIFIHILYKLKQAFARERIFARIDYLTEVSNRKNFFDLANKEISRSSRNKYPFTLMYLDLDDFKRVNDSFGHNAGDELLRLFAKTLQESVRLSDTVARLGGDEFAILLPETGSSAVKAAVGRIQNSLLDMKMSNDMSVTFSIGVITNNYRPCSVDELIMAADGLMYEAKHSGKNAVKSGVFGE